MQFGRSPGRTALAGFVAVAALVLLMAVATVDLDTAVDSAVDAVAPGVSLAFEATAYCKGETTRAGVRVERGMVASDPDVLPLGSVIRIDEAPDGYRGIYTVLDTGPAVQGRRVDLYMWSCFEALDFGRRPVTVTILRLGWDPRGEGAEPDNPEAVDDTASR